jgi:pyridoxal phosphate enzyme (YggS family)
VSDSLSARYTVVRDRIAAACARAGRDPDEVRLVAVSKGVAAERVAELAALGVTRFGENYVQEWTAKRERLADLPAIEWHFIGRPQRNKARLIATAALVHSVADARIAAALAADAQREDATVSVLVQVNVAGEATKGGVAPGALPALLVELRRMSGLRVRGLMTMPPVAEPERVRPFFRALRELRDRHAGADAGELVELSMGMSGDYEVAIEEGATLVRVGTALFGPRGEKA